MNKISDEEKRKQFLNIINGIDMVIMNNIAEVDPSVYENWESDGPMGNDECMVSQVSEDGEDDGLTWFHCDTHDQNTLNDNYCELYSEPDEIYQWFAIGQNDADFLKRHKQYVTYSDLLDTYFLAIAHCGTAWEYTSMVDDFKECYVEVPF